MIEWKIMEERELKVYEFYLDGVIYWVSGKDQDQATEHLKEKMIEWNGELDMPLEYWIIKEETENIEITYDEVEEDGSPIKIMSQDLIKGQTKPDILCCSEW